jgi:hypothetical protein
MREVRRRRCVFWLAVQFGQPPAGAHEIGRRHLQHRFEPGQDDAAIGSAQGGCARGAFRSFHFPLESKPGQRMQDAQARIDVALALIDAMLSKHP